MDENTTIIEIDLPTENWLLIDAVIDNVASIAAEDDDEETVAICEEIRVKGLEQIPDWPTEETELENWPAEGQRSLIRLTADEWAFVIEAVEEDAEVSEQIAAEPVEDDQQDEPDDPDWTILAAEARELAAYLTERVAS
ncbi:hypothetical protein [Glaciihabitans sp. dw_435]|uniref:hypothetical protein n=1 Tax=Glaciihabitans sp. dw_435 TaxID=2720081 RepID=UPI001BD54037|nr:hypothetical protein [Glaciihabitans sp. dw_435]